jgi:ATP-dependent DNA helicase RecG
MIFGMTVPLVRVPATDVDKTLALDEGHFMDVKGIEIAPSKLSRTLSAFANADGGELFVGIDEDKPSGVKTWRGFSSMEAANAHIQVADGMFMFSGEATYEFLEAPAPAAGLVLHISVRKTREIKKDSAGKPYVRRGAQNLPVATPELLDLLQRNKGITSFETNCVPVPVDLITNSEIIIEFMLAVVPIAEPYPWLKKQLLIQDEKPVVAALLLYADEPQVALPKRSAIKIYRYKTTEPEGTRETLAFDPLTVEGPLYKQIGEAVATTVRLIEEVQVLGPSGLESVAYPFETLHEIITNAVLHRDYGVADDVHVRIFDNRVEVESPGRLPAHITESNILDERFSRNGTLVRLVNKFPDPPNKDVGEGLNTAFAAMKRLKLRDPIIRQTENSVLVEIRHQRLGTPEEIILQYLSANSEITNKTVRQLTGIGSENRVKSIFYGLASAGQIERVPGKGGGSAAWRICREGPE